MGKASGNYSKSSGKGISSQKSIKIDGKLWNELDFWIKKPEVKKLGFHSKADFTTQAVREMLEKYSIEKEACDKFLRMYRRHLGYLQDQSVYDPSNFVDYIDKRLESKF